MKNRSQESTNQACVYAGGSSTRLAGRTYTGLTSRLPLSVCCKGSTEDNGDGDVKGELLPATYFLVGGGTIINM